MTLPPAVESVSFGSITIDGTWHRCSWFQSNQETLQLCHTFSFCLGTGTVLWFLLKVPIMRHYQECSIMWNTIKVYCNIYWVCNTDIVHCNIFSVLTGLWYRLRTLFDTGSNDLKLRFAFFWAYFSPYIQAQSFLFCIQIWMSVTFLALPINKVIYWLFLLENLAASLLHFIFCIFKDVFADCNSVEK